MFKLLLSIVLSTGFASTACAAGNAAAGNVEAGKAVFKWCASCHRVGPSARAGFGPQLNGLFGRKAGSTPDFKYSPAMQASGIVWNDDTLAAFLHDPGKLVPGTKMRFWGIGNDRQIADLLAYLRTFQAIKPPDQPPP